MFKMFNPNKNQIYTNKNKRKYNFHLSNTNILKAMLNAGNSRV